MDGDRGVTRKIEAREMKDDSPRADAVEEILKYDQEDLQAPLVVLCWLKLKLR